MAKRQSKARQRKTIAELETYAKWVGKMGSRPNSLLAEFGRPYLMSADTFKGRRHKRGKCYMNAALIALDNPDLIYVEGLVHAILPIEHAWLIDKAGNVIEPTLPADVPKGYFGIPFTTAYLRQTMLKTGYYGVIDGWRNRELFEGKTDGIITT